MNRLVLRALSLAVIFLLSACVACSGGDSGDDDTSPTDDSEDDDADDDLIDDDVADDDSDDDSGDDAGPTRPFRMAAAPMQYQIEPYHVETVFDFAGFDGRVDAVSLHMDSFFGVPWEEFADGEDPPQVWIDTMNAAKSVVEALGVPIYLSLTPLDGNRTGLAPYPDVDGEGRLITVADWNDPCYDFAAAPDAARYRTAYANYMAYMIDLFEPDFFTHVIELNLFDHFCEEGYGALIDFANDLYDEARELAPEIPIFPTFVLEQLWDTGAFGPCELLDHSCLDAQLATIGDVKRDRMALSAYPMFFVDDPEHPPEGLFADVAMATGERIMIAETGQSNRAITQPIDDVCTPLFVFDDADESGFLDFLLAEAETAHADLVVWWSLVDFLPDGVLAECPCDYGLEWCAIYDVMDAMGPGWLSAWLAWGSMGILDYEHNPKVSAAIWDDWLTRSVSP
ncbi:MAG: hypothetical protein IT350_17070 [Deltaproteobacteria bacterium]|nr:hypothetical protein [Deltaproteobacteria bacterium]